MKKIMYQILTYNKVGESLQLADSIEVGEEQLIEILSEGKEPVKNLKPFLHTAKKDNSLQLANGQVMRIVEVENI